MRIHPGGRPRDDAQPIFCSGVAEPATSRWLYPPPNGIFTYEDAVRIPQHDRLGKETAFHRLHKFLVDSESVDGAPEPIDITNGAPLLWWLWVANLGSLTQEFVGPGVVKVRVCLRQDQEVWLEGQRVDDTYAYLCAWRDGRGNVKTRLASDWFADA